MAYVKIEKANTEIFMHYTLRVGINLF